MNILVVDDEIYVRKTICAIICERFDKIFDIFQADSYGNAMEILSQIYIDVLITDIRMGDESGIELAQQVRKFHPECGIVFISAYDNKSYLKSAISLGAIAYIEKPIGEDELVSAVSEFYSDFVSKRDANQKKNESDRAALVEKIIHNNSDCDIKRCFKDVMDIEISGLLFKVGIIRYLPNRSDVIIDALINKKMSEFSMYCSKLLYQKKSEGVYVVIHMMYKTEPIDVENDIFSEMCIELNKVTNVLVATGTVVDDYTKVINSYDDAVVAMELAFYGECGNVMRSLKIEGLSDNNNFNVFDSIEQFNKLIRKYDKSLALRYIDTVYEQFDKSRNLPSGLVSFLFKQYVYHVYLLLSDNNSSMSDKDNTLDNMEFLTFHELYEYTIAEITKCFEKLKGDKLIADIEKYIDDNYTNPDLSISDISKAFHLSISYVCTKYKKVTGNTINGHITSVRMQHARTLLLQNEYSSEQVSELVGYRDPNYFSRNFKKVYGMTVTEYKKRL